VRELMLASGPARYFGGAIETFALPMGAFILIAIVLYYVFKRPHNVPRMKYLTPAHQTSVGTREPGTTGVITLRRAIPASAPAVEAETAVPGGQQPHASETLHQPVADRTEPAADEAAADQAVGDGSASDGSARDAAADHDAGRDAAGPAEGDA
jgi:hypothetical protein